MSHRFTIDYQADYEFIRAVYEELYPIKPDFSCEDILRLLDQKPEIYQINADYAGSTGIVIIWPNSIPFRQRKQK
ncbi:hypothetical protein [Spirosoma telluris]|uniref:hypothetical protein n=1 Tax=Spirosoma telluris TaxID=2183553 RepID=UPI0018DE887C